MAGDEIKIFDSNHVGDKDYEQNQADLRLLNLNSKKTSLEDPEADKTVTIVAPGSALEDKAKDFLT